jgi:hypothetical protein
MLVSIYAKAVLTWVDETDRTVYVGGWGGGNTFVAFSRYEVGTAYALQWLWEQRELYRGQGLDLVSVVVVLN